MSYPGERSGTVISQRSLPVVRMVASGFPELAEDLKDLSRRQVRHSARLATDAGIRIVAQALKRLMRSSASLGRRTYRKAATKYRRAGRAIPKYLLRQRTGESIKSVRIGKPRGYQKDKNPNAIGRVVYFAGRTPGWYGRLLASGWRHVAWGFRTGMRIDGTGNVVKAYSIAGAACAEEMKERFIKSIDAKVRRRFQNRGAVSFGTSFTRESVRSKPPVVPPPIIGGGE